MIFIAHQPEKHYSTIVLPLFYHCSSNKRNCFVCNKICYDCNIICYGTLTTILISIMIDFIDFIHQALYHYDHTYKQATPYYYSKNSFQQTPILIQGSILGSKNSTQLLAAFSVFTRHCIVVGPTQVLVQCIVSVCVSICVCVCVFVLYCHIVAWLFLQCHALLIVLLMLAASYHFVWHVERHIIGGERKKCVENTAQNCMFMF